jgi:hypothetical protein
MGLIFNILLAEKFGQAFFIVYDSPVERNGHDGRKDCSK